ncbi:DUF429 domain-containing protein [Thermoactinospora rubra]|uniref:DUF429 domain-containing protein n=1 Tax=Thermoactinospora rubra TaxID=1088767 RepID=UPI001180FE7D|nr:DUF429 domain-containing protein [Thermoactinospora rubra]
MRVLGVDGCRRGWIGVALDPGGPVRGYFAEDIAALTALAGPVDVVAVDMPIGLPDAGVRQADVLARRAVGRRWLSVFLTPSRAALEAGDHASAVAVNRRLTGQGVSRQAYALREKVLQVDRWVRGCPSRVVEVHPEVSFARLAGAALPWSKTTWAGMSQRRALLEGAGIVVPADLGAAGAAAAVDDVLDAAVAAWTARRVAAGLAVPLPDPPEVFGDGLPCAIWS